ncbi:uncharacterized protein KY384_004719 [Bacidia gigantensis]|uniref:uncharacterized protein n=1 Tax=Bacidia gigantensis TaxID=2732470 RepID=UPI001D05BD58|nr:uncharacterized protein KY384_004719 [Bacidia gigantensis]KAG8530219.1 hypothetical protein KY384_004719 [Bacidia gigantensis]
MDRTPTEVLKLIVKSVAQPDTWASRRDLSNLRQVNKRISAITTPLLFHTIPLWIGLKVSENASRQPSKQVIRRTIDEDALLTSIVELAATQYVSTRKRYIEEQRLLNTDSQARIIMTRALKQLANVRRFTILLQHPWIGFQELEKAFKYIIREEFDFSIAPGFFIALEAIVKGCPRLECLEILRVKGKQRPYKGFDFSHDDTFSTSSIALEIDKIDHEKLSLKDLTSFTIRLPEYDDDESDETDWMDIFAGLEELCHDSDKLHIVHIIGPKDEPEPSFSIMENMAAENPWKNVRILKLDNMKFKNNKTLVAFFQNRCNVLEEVYLKRMCLTKYSAGKDWTTGLRQMRKMRWAALKTFKLIKCQRSKASADVAPEARDKKQLLERFSLTRPGEE